MVVLICARGSVWVNDNLAWVDLAWAPAVACLLAALATGRPRPLARLLDSRPLRRLGSLSYSLYLTHGPIVIAVSYGLVRPWVAPGTALFLLLCAILVPLTVCFAGLFSAVFESPFRRHRGWRPLRAVVAARVESLLARARVLLPGHERVLAHPSGAQPVDPKPVRGQ